jgi:hypothetical protein
MGGSASMWLYFKGMKAVDSADTYAGRSGVARLSVAGHRTGGESINDMVDDVEVWLSDRQDGAAVPQ